MNNKLFATIFTVSTLILIISGFSFFFFSIGPVFMLIMFAVALLSVFSLFFSVLKLTEEQRKEYPERRLAQEENIRKYLAIGTSGKADDFCQRDEDGKIRIEIVQTEKKMLSARHTITVNGRFVSEAVTKVKNVSRPETVFPLGKNEYTVEVSEYQDHCTDFLYKDKSLYGRITRSNRYDWSETKMFLPDGTVYTMNMIGCGESGIECLIFCNNIQVAQAHKETFVIDDMHNYSIRCTSEEHAENAISLIMWLYAEKEFSNACVYHGFRTEFLKTTNEELLSLYNPDFWNEN